MEESVSWTFGRNIAVVNPRRQPRFTDDFAELVAFIQEISNPVIGQQLRPERFESYAGRLPLDLLVDQCH